ncbi:MAG: hypothetical protein HY268_13865 [Deltaproteobacteria bacterium]|nr:hypothetical protein [Deltaproteobacteria bacterium]
MKRKVTKKKVTERDDVSFHEYTVEGLRSVIRAMTLTLEARRRYLDDPKHLEAMIAKDEQVLKDFQRQLRNAQAKLRKAKEVSRGKQQR